MTVRAYLDTEQSLAFAIARRRSAALLSKLLSDCRRMAAPWSRESSTRRGAMA